MRRVIFCLLSWVLAMVAAFGDTENEPIPPAPTFRVGEIHLDWLKRGRLVQYDPGATQGLFQANYVYIDETGQGWPLVGNPWDVAHMIRSEVPEGVDESFIREYALLMLTGVNTCEALITKTSDVEQFIESVAYLEDDQESKAVIRRLLDLPDVRTRGGHWEAVFLTTTLREGIRLQRMSGELNPFSIEGEEIVMLKESDSGWLKGDVLRRALARKEATLKKWQEEANHE